MIPKLIHFNYFWQAIPDWAEANILEVQSMNPDCEVRTWTALPADLPQEIIDALPLAPTYRFRSDLVRMWILLQHGGVYMDTDVRPISPLDDAIWNCEAFAARHQNTHIADNYFMGSEPGHDMWSAGIANGIDSGNWNEPARYFGTVNTITGPSPEYKLLNDTVTLLDSSAVRDIHEPAEWREMTDDPRPALAPGGEYIKHYDVIGQDKIAHIDSWFVELSDLAPDDPIHDMEGLITRWQPVEGTK